MTPPKSKQLFVSNRLILPQRAGRQTVLSRRARRSDREGAEAVGDEWRVGGQPGADELNGGGGDLSPVPSPQRVPHARACARHSRGAGTGEDGRAQAGDGCEEAGPGAYSAGGPHPADRRHLQDAGCQQGYLLPIYHSQSKYDNV